MLACGRGLLSKRRRAFEGGVERSGRVGDGPHVQNWDGKLEAGPAFCCLAS